MLIRHDIHNHSLYSSCCYDPEATIEAYARRAKELGHTVFGISNHLWDEKVPGASKWYHQQMINFGLEGARAAMPSIPGIKLLVGTETEYCGMSDTLGMLAETAKRFDYVLVPHTHMHMKNFVISEMDDVKAKRSELTKKLTEAFGELSPDFIRKMVGSLGNNDIELLIGERNVDVVGYNAEFMVKSFMQLMNNSEFIKLSATVPTSIAHPFHPCGFGKDMKHKIITAVSDDDYLACFARAKELNVGIEINTSSFISDNDFADEALIHVMKLAKAAGCQFTFGTDTHSLAGLDGIRKGDRISELCGITEDDLPDYVK